MIRLAIWPPRVTVTLTRRRFAFARFGMTSDSRRAPFTTVSECATLAPETVVVMTTLAPAAACRLSERVTRNETAKRLPATGMVAALADPMIGLTEAFVGGGGDGGNGVDAVTS